MPLSEQCLSISVPSLQGDERDITNVSKGKKVNTNKLVSAINLKPIRYLPSTYASLKEADPTS